MRIQCLIFDGVFDTGLSVMLDAFATANELAQMSGMNVSPFDVALTSTRSRVTSAQGFRIPVGQAARRPVADWLVLPAIGYKMPAPLTKALVRKDIQEGCEVLRSAARRGSAIAAACIGTFVLGESGLLDGHQATTTWWLAPFFRERYPGVQLDESRMVVQSGRLVTAGAALGHMDLALWLIRQKSPKLAALTAKYLIVDSRPSQAAYAMVDHLAHSDPLVERFESWARGRLKEGFSLDDAARAVGASKRTLARKLHTVLGKTPLSYFQDLRVERAVHLLKTTDAKVDDIAGRVGYADGVTLRVLLRRKLGRGIRELRARQG